MSKYVPQAAMNAKRKSCIGWSIWNIILDFGGGFFSLVQLVGDAIDLNDLSSITGNPAKLGLSVITIFFDTIFFLQHYILYPENHSKHIKGDQELEFTV
eukprot:CAMPEP_0197252734 /NCGR_PEP_ID=MMETSP1429-20130617/62475_1 /TAXON_ID=49237 /ORGANISM="Chaetoceros  sp., Strain UNC1202" /LENGTH=98 /DNA_ID=CAMNT_0042715197 /DNA_START=160 /DNA_END=456 /DNA_ORIENTATION=-